MIVKPVLLLNLEQSVILDLPTLHYLYWISTCLKLIDLKYIKFASIENKYNAAFVELFDCLHKLMCLTST